MKSHHTKIGAIRHNLSTYLKIKSLFSVKEKEKNMAIRAEYIWIDGTEPLPYVRSKTKIVPDGTTEFPIWGFDGSSTNQAPGDNSDCVLRPVFSCPDPIRGGDNVLVLCDVCLPDGDMTPHPTNTRAACVETYEKYADQEPIFGIEQEYTFFVDGQPLGWPSDGFPAPQGPYYCGVGAIETSGREIVEAHTTACMEAGLTISGTNAEVMLGQWEFQIFAKGAAKAVVPKKKPVAQKAAVSLALVTKSFLKTKEVQKAPWEKSVESSGCSVKTEADPIASTAVEQVDIASLPTPFRCANSLFKFCNPPSENIFPPPCCIVGSQYTIFSTPSLLFLTISE